MISFLISYTSKIWHIISLNITYTKSCLLITLHICIDAHMHIDIHRYEHTNKRYQLLQWKNIGSSLSPISTYCSVNNASPMSPYGICNMVYRDCIQMLVVACGFNKELLVQVVHVVLYKHMDISHHFQNIYTLLKRRRKNL